MKIPDQKTMWDKKHSEGEHDWFADTPSPLALKVFDYLQDREHILEIGCGNGRDARYFAAKGYEVTATDFSDVAIAKNNEDNKFKNLKFSVLDVREKLLFSDRQFDVVYSSLALHYYSDEQTREIFGELHRVLKDGGILAFACKSHDEVRMKDAEVVEQNTYVDKGGHVLHAFSINYVHDLLNMTFELLELEEVDEEYSGRVSTVIRCIARKS